MGKCKGEKCNGKTACYNYESMTPKFCTNCKKEGMIYVKKKNIVQHTENFVD